MISSKAQASTAHTSQVESPLMYAKPPATKKSFVCRHSVARQVPQGGARRVPQP